MWAQRPLGEPRHGSLTWPQESGLLLWVPVAGKHLPAAKGQPPCALGSRAGGTRRGGAVRGAKAKGRGRLVEGWGGRGHRSDRMQASVQTLFQTPQEPFGVPAAQPVPFLTHTSSASLMSARAQAPGAALCVEGGLGSPNPTLQPEAVPGKVVRHPTPAVKCGAHFEAGIHCSGSWDRGDLESMVPSKVGPTLRIGCPGRRWSFDGTWRGSR